MKTAPAPDVDRLIIGGKVRQRRRNLARVGVAAVAVLVAGGVYGVTRSDHGTAVGPAVKPPPTNASHTYLNNPGTTIQPGTYRMLLGKNDVGAAVHANITFDNTAWQSAGANDPLLLKANSNGGVAVYKPLGLAAGTGCGSDNKLNTNLGDTPQSLAQQLAQLPQSTVLQAPTPVQAFGRDAVHLRLRINNNCGSWLVPRRRDDPRRSRHHLRTRQSGRHRLLARGRGRAGRDRDVARGPLAKRAGGPDRQDPGLDHLVDHRVGQTNRTIHGPIQTRSTA